MPDTSLHKHGCRVSDEWTLRGMRAAILENELLRVLVLLDRGAEIVEFCYKPLDFDPLLRLPVELRNPARDMPSVGAGSGTFLDYYAGGWQEILPNGGGPVSYKGADYGRHDEGSLLPWSCEVLEPGPERASLRCSVRALRTPLRLQRTMTIERGRAVLFIDEQLTNEAGEALDIMWGHHVAFGLPFLQEGAVIETSARTLLAHEDLPGFAPRRLQIRQRANWPVALAADGSNMNMSIVPPHGKGKGREISYLTDFDGPAWYSITNPDRQVVFAFQWDGSLFRYLWLWQELGYPRGFPWWGRSYAVALEPWTSYPTLGLPEAIARGTQLKLRPGQIVNTHMVASAYAGLSRVYGVRDDGTVI